MWFNLLAQNKIESKYSSENFLINTFYHVDDKGHISINDELQVSKRLKNSNDKVLSLKLDSVYLKSNGNSSVGTVNNFYYNSAGYLAKSLVKDHQTGHVNRETYYYYNSLGLLERERLYSYSSSNAITDSSETFYLYNQDSLIIERNFFGIVNNNYDTASAYRYVYDNNSRLIADQQRRWFNNAQQVINSLKHRYIYSNNRIDTIYEYNGFNVGWLLNRCYISNYNSQNQLESIEKMLMGVGTWISYQLTKYNYYPNGLLNEEILCEWETVMSGNDYNYISEFKTKNIYDNSQNKIIKKIDYNNYFNLYYPAENWEDMYVDSLSVNSSSYASDLVYPSLLNLGNRKYFFVNNPSKYVFYHENINDQFVKESTLFFFYSNFSVGLSASANTEYKVNIYPNPFKSEFYISCDGIDGSSDITVYNAVGKLVFKKKISSSNETVHLPNLDKGIYFVKIINNKSIITNLKIIKI